MTDRPDDDWFAHREAEADELQEHMAELSVGYSNAAILSALLGLLVALLLTAHPTEREAIVRLTRRYIADQTRHFDA